METIFTEFRQHIEEISKLTDDEFEYILSHFVKKKFRKHQFLIQQDEPVKYEYFVLNGCVKAYTLDHDTKMHILQFGMQDWWIGDYQAYFKQIPATLYVDCIEDTEVLCLTLENREKLCTEMHKFEHFTRKKLNSGYVALQQRILSLLNSTPKERYEQLLVQYPSLFQKVPKQYIAAYLGVSRETLSRLNSVVK
ncbi:cAMP-binding domain of CRP or a regulatory subunit of cAMP-dependent protein kinases [Pedobacter westerhofensis]|uniref:cAMP-binding domain of CRP or a regulatory subunit of cAMP-dependent protein kinases n=1 Tax=Pedobacter westerhofensis TaxID=425512 RepID=A0A521CRC5_9SPHI|nr:Crp/Fnr family transcriptional regulator [Pedobacter westerhofensis]SMO61925.1 cAMP-binding domain of CRP or a regulatory subunit of cAMP-dependent protein kinases [Pedobacter westerhofensis]